MKRLGLARDPDDPLFLAVRAGGWEPVSLHLTAMAATLAEPPVDRLEAVLVLSPAAARLGLIPAGVLCLAQGEATARALAQGPGTGARQVLVSAAPRAEGLMDLLRERFPQGGTFLLARGERSREHLEQVCEGTPWHLVPWVTHREIPVDPPPPLAGLDAVLALSPLQAELLAPRAGGFLCFAWGQRTARAFQQAGHPADAWCDPEPPALRSLLAAR